MFVRTTASSRKTIAVAIVALAIVVSALAVSTVNAVTAPIYVSGLTLAKNAAHSFKAL